MERSAARRRSRSRSPLLPEARRHERHAERHDRGGWGSRDDDGADHHRPAGGRDHGAAADGRAGYHSSSSRGDARGHEHHAAPPPRDGGWARAGDDNGGHHGGGGDSARGHRRREPEWPPAAAAPEGGRSAAAAAASAAAAAAAPTVASAAAARAASVASAAAQPAAAPLVTAPPLAAAARPVNATADFGLSGALAQDAHTGNALNGVVLKWSEPADAATPPAGGGGPKWRLHVFKGSTQLDSHLHVHRQSAYLFGRERKVADVPTDHPSCSSQHAVLQFRAVAAAAAAADEEVGGGLEAALVRTVKPYIMDLESTNGTFLNGARLPPARYVELRPGDVLRFGTSSREFVLMHDQMGAGVGR